MFTCEYTYIYCHWILACFPLFPCFALIFSYIIFPVLPLYFLVEYPGAVPVDGHNRGSLGGGGGPSGRRGGRGRGRERGRGDRNETPTHDRGAQFIFSNAIVTIYIPRDIP